MKAVKLKIGFREWDKLDDFVEMINEEADVLAYEVDSTTALLVAFGDCGMEWLKSQAAQWFDNIDIEIIK